MKSPKNTNIPSQKVHSATNKICVLFTVQNCNSNRKLEATGKNKKERNLNLFQSYKILIIGIFFAFLFTESTFAQNDLLLGVMNNVMKFADGKVYFVNGDSLSGQLKLRSKKFGNELIVMKLEGRIKRKIYPEQVRYFVHRNEEYIPYERIFMQIILEGKIRLYKHTHISNQHYLIFAELGRYLGGSKVFEDEFIVLKNGEIIKIRLTDKNRGFHKKMMKVFEDDHEIYNKIINKNYNKVEFSKMIVHYNKKHNQSIINNR